MGITVMQKSISRMLLVAIASMLAVFAYTALTAQKVSAQEIQADPYATQTPTVLPTLIRKEPQTPPDHVQPNRFGDRGEELPFTGADLTLFVATGLAAIGTGAVIVRRTRSKDSDAG